MTNIIRTSAVRESMIAYHRDLSERYLRKTRSRPLASERLSALARAAAHREMVEFWQDVELVTEEQGTALENLLTPEEL